MAVDSDASTGGTDVDILVERLIGLDCGLVGQADHDAPPSFPHLGQTLGNQNTKMSSRVRVGELSSAVRVSQPHPAVRRLNDRRAVQRPPRRVHDEPGDVVELLARVERDECELTRRPRPMHRVRRDRTVGEPVAARVMSPRIAFPCGHDQDRRNSDCAPAHQLRRIAQARRRVGPDCSHEVEGRPARER